MPRIMLIEDDVITREIYCALLTQNEYEVLTVTEVGSAWTKLQTEPVDAVLMDLVIPDVHGLELLRNVRSHKTMKELPVIVYTGLFVPNVVEEAIQAGATHVFDKAYLGASKLLDALQECLIPRQKAA